MKAITEDRDDMRTKSEVLDQAMTILMNQQRAAEEDDDEDGDTEKEKGDGDGDENAAGDDFARASEDAAAAAVGHDVEPNEKGGDEDGDDGDGDGDDDDDDDEEDEHNEWEGKPCNPFGPIDEDEKAMAVADRKFVKAPPGFFTGRGMHACVCTTGRLFRQCWWVNVVCRV